jgi:hypothetical protein
LIDSGKARAVIIFEWQEFLRLVTFLLRTSIIILVGVLDVLDINYLREIFESCHPDLLN